MKLGRRRALWIALFYLPTGYIIQLEIAQLMGGTVVRYVSFETENGVPTNSNTSNSNSNSSTKRGRIIACRVMPPLQSQTELVNAGQQFKFVFGLIQLVVIP